MTHPSKLRKTILLPSFNNEKEMRDFLAKNLERLEPGLTLYDDGETNGVEVPCRITTWGRQGSIDILATDKNGGLVIIECKHKYGDAMAFGQVLGYMTWVNAWINNAPPSPHAWGEVGKRSIGRAESPVESPPATTGEGVAIGEGHASDATEQRTIRAFLVCKRANPLLKALLDAHPTLPVTVFEYEFSLQMPHAS